MNKAIKIGAVMGAAAVIAAGALGVAVWVNKPSDTNTLYIPAEVTGSGVVDGFGNELTSGNTYAMPTSVVYTATTQESATASEGITLSVKVTPVNVADKSIDYAVNWKDETSEWATGKVVTDYVTLTPTADGSTVSTLKCLQEFGEQVIVTATSRQNPSISATCTVDFAQRVTGYTVKLGTTDIFASGEDYRCMFTLAETSNTGGEISASYTLNDVYTLGGEFTHRVALEPVNGVWNTGIIASDVIANAIGRSITFDKRLFQDYTVYYKADSSPNGLESAKLLRDCTDDELKDIFAKTDWSNLFLWTLKYTVTGTNGVQMTVSKRIGCMGYFVPPVMVSGLEFEEPNIVFKDVT